MSYRELRDFTEHMKTLGYSTGLSHASFRQPNFPLVASCLLFLLRRYDPTLITADDISTQQARITFIQSITQLLWSKCNVKLSMKQLYRADGYAVKEMLKLSAVLYAAMAANSASAATGTAAAASTSPLAADGASGAPTSLDTFKAAKSLATALIDTADRLSELLGREATVRVARDTAIAFVDQLNETTGTASSSSNSSSNNVERHIKRQLQLIADNTAELKALTATTTADVDKQKLKFERKLQERDRLTKRWQALRRVKPAFMEEYEREEKELRGLYGVYVERVRNVRWLEGEMREMREAEEEERKERERQRVKVQKRMKEEERRMLRGEGDDDDEGSGEEDEEDEEEDEDDDRDEKRMYERKDRAGDEDEDEEEDGEGEGDEDEEEDEDELDSENEHKRPARRPPQKQPANAAIMRGRDNKGGGGGAGGGKGGRQASHNDMDMGSESDGSAMGDDDYF